MTRKDRIANAAIVAAVTAHRRDVHDPDVANAYTCSNRRSGMNHIAATAT